MLAATVSKDASIIWAAHYTYAFIPEDMQSTFHAVRIRSFDERAEEMGKAQFRGSYEVLGRIS